MKILSTMLCIFLFLGCKKDIKKTEETTESVVEEEFEQNNIPVETDNGIGDGAESIEALYVQNIEKAHAKKAFLDHDAIQFDLQLFFGGKERLNGKIIMKTNSSQIKIIRTDGSELIYNGSQVYLNPSDADDKGARFAMFTWPYFFAMPYKLNDPGTNWAMEQDREIDDKTYPTAKLTFDKGTGDSPDDWYLVYSDPETHVLKAAAYIVTYGSDGDVAKAQADPHAIVYENFEEINGVPIATEWQFHGWSPEKGMTKNLGNATLSNFQFVEKTQDMFVVPKNAKALPLQ